MSGTPMVTSRTVGSVTVLDVHKLTTSTPRDLRRLVQTSLGEGARDFLFNLFALERIDSLLVGEIVASQASVGRVGGCLRLAALSPRVQEVFKTTGLLQALSVYETEAAALKAFAQE